MKPKTAGFILTKIMGWHFDLEKMPNGRGIILGAPHTSIWDFIVAALFAKACGYTPHTMIKKEFFFFPLGPILRSIGCIPTDRGRGAEVLRNVITTVNKAIENDEPFVLCIAPEGTRKPVKRWKAGYHTIATATGLPVFAGYFDWGTKTVGRGEQMILTDDPKADTLRIQEYYESRHYVGKHPEGYVTR